MKDIGMAYSIGIIAIVYVIATLSGVAWAKEHYHRKGFHADDGLCDRAEYYRRLFNDEVARHLETQMRLSRAERITHSADTDIRRRRRW